MDDEEKIKKYLLGKNVQIVTLDGYIKNCTILAYNDKVVETDTPYGELVFIPWTYIRSITVYNRDTVNDGDRIFKD